MRDVPSLIIRGVLRALTVVVGATVMIGLIFVPLLAAAQAPNAPQTSGPLVVGQGHVDVFHVGQEGGRPFLALAEDSTGSKTLRAPEGVLLHVRPRALMHPPVPKPGTKPRPFPVPLPAYVLPETQDPHLIWPGWNSGDAADGGLTDTSIHVTSVQGPGTISIFGVDMTGALLSQLRDGGVALPGIIDLPEPTHNHAYWAFSAEGTYRLTAHVTAVTDGGVLTSSERRYTFVVGELQALPTVPPAATSTPAPTSLPTAPPVTTPPFTVPPVTPVTTSATPSASSTSPSPSTPGTPGTSGSASPPGSPIRLDRGHVDALHVSRRGSQISLQLRDDATRPGSPQMRRPEEVILVVPPHAKWAAMPDGLPGAGHPAYVLPQTQDHAKQLLWPGWSTEALHGTSETEAHLEIQDVQGPGSIHLFTMRGSEVVPVLRGGALTLPGVIAVPRPAHVHANWVFTEPGVYTMRATAVVGRLRSDTHRYTFEVGGVSSASPTAPTPSGPGPSTPSAQVPTSPGSSSTAAPPSAPAPALSSTAETAANTAESGSLHHQPASGSPEAAGTPSTTPLPSTGFAMGSGLLVGGGAIGAGAGLLAAARRRPGRSCT